MILSRKPHPPVVLWLPNPERDQGDQGDLPGPVFDGSQALAQALGRLQGTNQNLDAVTVSLMNIDF